MITTINEFKKIYEAMNKQNKDSQIFDYKSITNDLWRKIIQQAQKFQKITFDLENNDSTNDKRILSMKRKLRKDQTVTVKVACELCEAGGDWEASAIYFKIEFISQYGTISNKYESNPQFVWDIKDAVDSRKFVLIPPSEFGNVNLVCNNGKCSMKPAEEHLERTDKDIKKAWKWLETTLTDVIDQRWEMLDKDQNESSELTSKDPQNIREFKQTYSNDKIVYDAFFVDDINALMERFPKIYDKTYYHHMTVAFMPKELTYPQMLGKKENLKIIGRITTDKVDALLVESQYSKNKYPHITLSTAPGIKPVESNNAFQNHPDQIEYFNEPIYIKTTYGFE